MTNKEDTLKIVTRSKKDISKILYNINQAILWYDHDDSLYDWLNENEINQNKLTSCIDLDSYSDEVDIDTLMKELDDLGYLFCGHQASTAYAIEGENKSRWEDLTIPHFMSLYENWLKRDIIINDLDGDSLPYYCYMDERIGDFITNYLGIDDFDEEEDMDKDIDLINCISSIEPGEGFGIYLDGGSYYEYKEWIRNQYIRHGIKLS